jgi:hypothetical protein
MVIVFTNIFIHNRFSLSRRSVRRVIILHCIGCHLGRKFSSTTSASFLWLFEVRVHCDLCRCALSLACKCAMIFKPNLSTDYIVEHYLALTRVNLVRSSLWTLLIYGSILVSLQRRKRVLLPLSLIGSLTADAQAGGASCY